MTLVIFKLFIFIKTLISLGIHLINLINIYRIPRKASNTLEIMDIRYVFGAKIRINKNIIINILIFLMHLLNVHTNISIYIDSFRKREDYFIRSFLLYTLGDAPNTFLTYFPKADILGNPVRSAIIFIFILAFCIKYVISSFTYS